MSDFLEGFDAKGDLNGQPVAIKYFRLALRRTRQDVANTEGKRGNPLVAGEVTGFGSFMGTNRYIEVEVRQATLDMEGNFFAGPTAIALDEYCELKIYPAGRDNDFHFIPSLMIETITHEGEAGVLQPHSFTGVSDGQFALFGEVK
jgi:hypothetical protein